MSGGTLDAVIHRVLGVYYGQSLQRGIHRKAAGTPCGTSTDVSSRCKQRFIVFFSLVLLRHTTRAS